MHLTVDVRSPIDTQLFPMFIQDDVGNFFAVPVHLARHALFPVALQLALNVPLPMSIGVPAVLVRHVFSRIPIELSPMINSVARQLELELWVILHDNYVTRSCRCP